MVAALAEIESQAYAAGMRDERAGQADDCACAQSLEETTYEHLAAAKSLAQAQPPEREMDAFLANVRKNFR